MKKFLKDWNKFEIILMLASVITVITSGILFDSSVLTIICSIVGMMVALTQAKGKIISQFIGIIFVALYSILAFQTRYYGEVLLYVFIMLPLFVFGIISWIKNVDKDTDIVKKMNCPKMNG